MSKLLREYEERLRPRELAFSQGPAPAPNKFTPDGLPVPFYGFTCIAWVDASSRLFHELRSLQTRIARDLTHAGLENTFAWLPPSSFHMTVCDVVASSQPITHEDAEILIRWVQGAFARIQAPGPVHAYVRGLGLDTTITAQVRFQEARELRKVYVMEREIKDTIRSALRTGHGNLTALLSFRPFAGHISLAYCTRDLEQDQRKRVREILARHGAADFGLYISTSLDLTCFTNMNAYTPLLTLDLEHGTVATHDHLQQCHCKA